MSTYSLKSSSYVLPPLICYPIEPYFNAFIKEEGDRTYLDPSHRTDRTSWIPQKKEEIATGSSQMFVNDIGTGKLPQDISRHKVLTGRGVLEQKNSFKLIEDRYVRSMR